MPKTREKYVVAGVDLYHVRNRNEKRVADSLRALLEKRKLKNLAPDILKDAFAFALNALPARYTQRGTIVLRDPVRRADIDKAVAEALDHVRKHPK